MESVNMDALVSVAREIATRRKGVLESLRSALERNDVPTIIELSRRLTGLSDGEQASNRVN
jgi:hypothetical protein